ncbi:hypothetical protein [Clostridioides difficile]|uniref:hypothetical protein n=1 Tax=Clostridioides difficile TaxID=1496 RepID=UPI002FCDB2F2
MWITINRNSNISLSRQIYCEIKDMILDGSLKFEQNCHHLGLYQKNYLYLVIQF